MKHIVVVLFALFIAGSSFAQTERKVSHHESDKQAEENRSIIKSRLDQLESALKSAQWEPHKAQGLDAPELERKSDQEWQKWFLGVRQDLHEYARKCKSFLKMDDKEVVSEMAQMNMQFLALQEATQMESRKFQTLSNASKARHDIAMNAIRNMK